MAPFFTGIARGVGGFGFGRSAEVAAGPFSATGGTILTPGNGYAYHVFISSGSFVVSSGGLAEVLIVAGGGGGGGYAYGGGGGAGGVVYGSSVPLAAQTYTVTIGSGGSGVAPSGAPPSPTAQGGPSSFGLVTAIGGGAGGTYNDATNRSGRPGGSSGGPSGYVAETVNATPQPVPGSYIAYGSPSIAYNYGEGGGGAGGPNQPNPYGGPAGSLGGPGQAFPVFPSTIIGPAIPAPEQPYWTPEVGPQGYFGGGGGGAAYYTTANVPAGGIGGGGDGGGPFSGGPVNGWPGVNFTGGGGGGTNYNSGGVNQRNPTYNGGNGGSGIVLIRYPY